MRRITVEEVLEAYRVKGLKPSRGVYLYAGCACPIGAIASCVGVSCEDDVIDWAETILGTRYHEGFVDAIDGTSDDEQLNPLYEFDVEYSKGYADGQAVAAAVFAQGAK